MKKFLNKKIILIALLCLLLSLLFGGYYTYIEFQKLDSFGEKIYTLSRKELAEQTLLKEDITSYNKTKEDIELNNSFQVRKQAAQIANEFYGGLQEEEPYIVKFNENQGTWIIQGNSWWLTKNNMFGGVMYLVLDKNNGDILYISHTV